MRFSPSVPCLSARFEADGPSVQRSAGGGLDHGLTVWCGLPMRPDHKLDIEVADDLSTWRWKDEDDLSWMIQRGLYSPEKGWAIRTAGWAAIARMEARQAPFQKDWSGMEPDSSWTVVLKERCPSPSAD
jgi:hypothetical protein